MNRSFFVYIASVKKEEEAEAKKEAHKKRKAEKDAREEQKKKKQAQRDAEAEAKRVAEEQRRKRLRDAAAERQRNVTRRLSLVGGGVCRI